MSCEEQFLQQLRDHGFRFTPQREMVLTALHNIDGFPTAEEIYHRVHAQCTSVDISTVYRTLDLLEEFQLVAVLDLGNGHRRYELLSLHGLHHHLCCRLCGKVIPVPHKQIAPLLGHLEKTYGFSLDAKSLTFSGLCDACPQAQEVN